MKHAGIHAGDPVHHAAAGRHARRAPLLGLALAAGFAAGAPAATLVENGVNRTTLIVREDAGRREVLGYRSRVPRAVEDLSDYLEKITGARPEIAGTAEAARTPVRIWIGHHDDLAARFPDVDLTLDAWEQVVLAGRGDDILILGRDGTGEAAAGRHPHEAGTSLAVYTFIERNLGVRWLWPGELGEDVPRHPTLTLEDFTHTHRPIMQRQLYRGRNLQRNVEETFDPALLTGMTLEDALRIAAALDEQVYDWQRRQRGFEPGYGLGFTGQHAFNHWYERFSEEHPEYFALHPDGTRSLSTNATNVKLCISNPAVAERWAEIWEQDLRRDPRRIIANIGPGDGAFSGLCACEHCRAWDVPGGEDTFTLRWSGGHQEESHRLTDRYVQFWNRASRLLRERMPDGRPYFVGTIAYGLLRPPPLEQTLESDITVAFVGPFGGGPPSRRAHDRASWAGWAEHASILTWRPNLFHLHWGTPTLFTRRLAEDLRFMAERNLAGINVDTVMNHWSTQGLQYYVLTQLAWDPFRDRDELVADYVTRAFGAEAAHPMRRYVDALEERYYGYQDRRDEDPASATGKGGAMRRIDLFPETFDAAFLANMEALLDQARAVAATDLHRSRIDFVRVGLDFTRAQMRAITAMSALRNAGEGERAPLIRAALQATAERDRILVEQFDSLTLNSAALFSRGTYEGRGMAPYLGPVHERDRRSIRETPAAGFGPPDADGLEAPDGN